MSDIFDDKHEEKEEKDFVSYLTFGLMLILLGVSFMLVYANYLTWENWWTVFLMGFGIILLINAAIRYTVPAYKKPVGGKIFIGVLMFIVGLAGYFRFEHWWPLVFIVAGIAVIIAGIRLGKAKEEKQ